MKKLWFLLGGLLVMLPAWHVLLGHQLIFAGRDLTSIVLPAKYFWRQSVLQEFAIPRWNSYIEAGTPYYADGTLGPLLPFNLLFLVVPNFFTAFNWFIALHIILIYGCAHFVFKKVFGPSFLAMSFALLASWQGVVWSGILDPQMNIALAAAWLFCGALFEGNRILLTLAMIMPIYGGDPEYSYLMGLLLLPCLRLTKHAWSESLKTCALSGVLAFLLAAPQTLPLWDLAKESQRGLGKLSAEIAERASFAPVRLLDLFWPLPFGNRVPVDTFGHPSFLNASEPYLFSFYFGFLLSVLGLALAVFLLRNNRATLRLPAKLCVGAVVALLFGFGIHTPLYGWAFRFLPGFNFFRYPERLMALVGLFLLLAIAFMLASAWQNLSKRRFLMALAIVLCLFDLARVDRALVWAQPRDIVDPRNHPWAPIIHDWLAGQELGFKAGGPRRFSSYSEITEKLDPINRTDLDPVGKTIWSQVRWLEPNHSALFGLENIEASANFSSQHWLELKKLFSAREQYNLFMGVGLQVGKGFALESAPLATPYFYAAKSEAPKAMDLASWIASGAWSGREVWLDSPVEPFPPLARPRVELLGRNSHAFRVRVAAAPSAFYVWSEQFSSHWRASLDSRELPVHRVNGWAMGVQLPPDIGQNEVLIDWNYENPWIEWGKALCLVGLGIVFLVKFQWLKSVFGRKYLK